MRSFRLNWLMPVMITISALFASICVFGNIQSPMRFLVVLWFLLVCPGMPFIELLEINDKFTVWTLAVALSLAIDTAISLIVLYLDQWSVELIVGILAAVTLSGIALQVWKSRKLFGLGSSNAV